MRTIYFTGMFLVCLLLQAPLAMGQAEDALVAYWSFDEGSGKTVKDISGNGLDGEFVDQVDWVPGKFGGAVDFGAGGGYVLVKHNELLNLSKDLAYMGWFNLNEPIVGQRRMMSKNNSIFFLFDFGLPTSLDFLVKPNNDFVESTTEFQVGQWYHFAGTYDGDALRIYIDGVLEGEKTGVPEIALSDLDLWIGADDWQLPTSTFPGMIDDVRIYNRALTESEIIQATQGPLAVDKRADQLAVLWARVKQER